MASEPAAQFGPFRIVGRIGSGGMAAVYKAYDPELDRYVALKVLPATLLHDGEFARRFEREAKVIARLEHPHIVPIHRFGIDNGTPWMSMRLLRVATLADVLAEGTVGASRMVAILSQVADALDHAHRRHVIHRDVKPGNILFDDDERAYVGDFGLARLAEASVVLTQTGTIAGTPQYMSPEQALGKRIDHRADLYALGVIAYQMVTRRLPFTADTTIALLMKHVREPVPVPAPDEVPESVSGPILRCLEKEPARRWSTASSFVQALADGLAALSRDATVVVAANVGTGAAAAGPADTAVLPAGESSARRTSLTAAVEAVPASSSAAAPTTSAADGSGAPPLVFESVARSRRGGGPANLVRAGVGAAALLVLALAVFPFVTRDGAVPERDADASRPVREAAPTLPGGTTEAAGDAPAAEPAEPADARAAAGASPVSLAPPVVDVPPRGAPPPARPVTAAPATGTAVVAARARSAYERGDLPAALDAIEAGLQLDEGDPTLRQLLAALEVESRRRATRALDDSIGVVHAAGEALLDDGYARLEEGQAFGESRRPLAAARAFLAAEGLFVAARGAAAAGAGTADAGTADVEGGPSSFPGRSGSDVFARAGDVHPNDRRAVERAVRRYARAYERESTVELKAVFPSLSRAELNSIDRSFLDWESVAVDLVIRRMSVEASRAELLVTQRQEIVTVEGVVRRTEMDVLMSLTRPGGGAGGSWVITGVRQVR